MSSIPRALQSRRIRPSSGRIMCLAVLWVAVVATTVTATPAHASDDEVTARIEAKAAEAAKHFQDKNFAKAVRAYIEAYQIAQRPSELLYNIAFIYDYKLNELEMAEVYYKKYAATVDGDPALVEKAVRRMGELRKIKNTPKPPDKPDGDGTNGNGGNKNVANVDKPPKATDGDPGAGQRTAGYATLITGGVALVAGASLMGVAFAANQDFKSTTSATERADLESRGKAMALAGDVLVGVGAVAAIAGIVLVATAPSAPEGSGDVNVTASPISGGAAIFFSGSL